MADIFISYSSVDERFAKFLHDHLKSEGVEVFLASASLKPGQTWSQEILSALKASTVVLFLASKAACDSSWVQQELGAALISQKKVIPIVWDIQPHELPGWSKQLQAVDLRGETIDSLKVRMKIIADEIKSDKAKGALIMGLLIAGVLALG